MKRTLISLASLVAFVSLCNAETIYFLLGPPPVAPNADSIKKRGSVVIPLSDLSHIAHARGLINGTVNTAKHAGMYIRAGKNGINRNYYDPAMPEWSWYPLEVIRFADIIAQGTAWEPDRLERSINWSDPMAWNEARPVGFAELTVVRELGPAPVVLSVVQDGTRLHFNWNLIETTQAMFTLEQTKSLTNPVWQAVPGAGHVKTNAWMLDLGSERSVFYRVAVTLN